MRRSAVLIVPLVLLLTACGSPYRTGSPAPVVSHGKPVPPTSGQATSGEREGGEPMGESTQVRAYRAPQDVRAPQQVARLESPPATRAVGNLMERARVQAEQGDHAGAQSSLERALRIEPRNPQLYNRLAHVHLSQQAYARAEQFAAKSNSLTAAGGALVADNWNIIARAREALGDQAGARRARDRSGIR